MEGTYELRLGETAVGTVRVRREGLYYALSCRCPRLRKGMFELIAGEHDLGLLVPTGGTMGLECRVAVKRIGEGNIPFSLRERSDESVPIDAQTSFPYLQRLNEAYLCKKGNELHLAFRKK